MKVVAAAAVLLWSCSGYGQTMWEGAHLTPACNSGMGQSFNLTVYGPRTVELKISVYAPLDASAGKSWEASRFPVKGSSFATLCDKEKGLCLPMSDGRMRISAPDKSGARRVGFEYNNGQSFLNGAIVVQAKDADPLPKDCS